MNTTSPTNHIKSESTSSAVVRRFVADVLNRGRFDVLAEVVHPDYHYEGPDGVRLHGIGELEALIGGFRAGFSDFQASITSAACDGDLVAMTMTLTGTHDGEFDGIPPTGARMSLPIAVFTRVKDNRIVEDREFYDTATMLAQLGLTP
ncbi:MAG: ester cyclase [Acidimicrobiia bacterium]|nr:ester cyclase [Acidimicrobiia bacterium]